MATIREKFATQVNAKTLAALRRLAEKEGRQLQALVDEALADLLEKRRTGRPRTRVMDAYQRSHARYGELYKKLAQ
jgi:mRNA-degrading endonuclease RelE of RelBE toxin-antitoxin system